jgi:hypothetical protein
VRLARIIRRNGMWWFRGQVKQLLLAHHALFMLSAVIESPHAGVQVSALLVVVGHSTRHLGLQHLL